MQSSSIAYTLIIGALIVVFMAGCGKDLSHERKVLFTILSENDIKSKQINSIENKYVANMKIAIADMGDRLENIEELTAEFNSARAPEISHKGTWMVFSGQKRSGDIWQIWAMNLETKEILQVTESRTNCTDPTWLPNGDIAFSKLVTEDNSLKYHALHTIGADGCCEQRITFHPHDDVNASILHDGRILVASKQVFPEHGTYKYLALRPDGTKAELFHMADAASNMIGKSTELSGKVYFNESTELRSVKFSRPLHSQEQVINEEQAEVISTTSIDDKRLLISVKNPDEKTFGLAVVGLENPTQQDFFYNDSEHHCIEAVVVKERSVPRNLPSRVNPELSSGFFFSMNANASDIEVDGKTAMVQVLGMNDIIGEAPVEEDGSFYLELAADRPVRFQTRDENGEILRGPSSWMWIRPNERRGCAGCHQDREVAPSNVVPKAMEKAPLAMIR